MASHKEDFPVVGVGASAGGLEAYRRLLAALPADSGVAFIFIQHLDPNHESMMADLLSRYTSMPVVQAEDAMPLEPDNVYVIPPNKYIKIVDHGLFLDEPVTQRGMRMSIDYFFRSIADVRGDRGIAIVLSGTGTDGTLGCREIKAAGGMVMVQKPESADYDGMPQSAIASGAVDFVLEIDDMPKTLKRYLEHPYIDGKPPVGDFAQQHSGGVKTVLQLLREHTDYDFSNYKRGTLQRRIQRRMGLHHMEKLDEYVGLIRSNAEEASLLFRDLLINVTRFFRDPKCWEVLADQVLGPLIQKRRNGSPFRIWVPGCASGEEAFTLAIVILDLLDRQQKHLDLQIFATDLSQEAIATARNSVYASSIESDIPDRFRKRYFAEDGDQLRLVKRVREAVVFANQNVISDPPFSKLDVVSCRNLMIYLEPDTQLRLIEMFHFALSENGILILGSSEGADRPPNLFEPIDKAHRIYRRCSSARVRHGNFPLSPGRTRTVQGEAIDRTSITVVNSVEYAKRALLDRFVPAAVLVNNQFEVQYMHGPLRDYLDYPSGEPTSDLLSLAFDGLKPKLRSLLLKVRKEGGTVEAAVRRVQRDGAYVAVRITGEAVGRSRNGNGSILVHFEDVPNARQGTPSGNRSEVGELPAEEETLIQQLESELQAVREDLQSTIENTETANEELKASNEEVMSMNEELQSTNEELETSREELQSLNEELSTVNSQLQEKIQQLEATSNDLANLLTSTNIATLFLDTNLRIRRYTPAAAELMRIDDSDLGRPVDDLALRMKDPELRNDARTVLDQLQPVESEVESIDGNFFIRRTRPYRTVDNKIEGVVMTFTDVTRLRQVVDQVRAREQQQSSAAELGREALSDAPLSQLFERAVTDARRHLEMPFAKILALQPGGNELLLVAGLGWRDGLVGQACVDAGHSSQAGFTLQRSAPVLVEDFASEKRFSAPKLLVDHSIVAGVSVMIGPASDPWGVLAVHHNRPHRFSVDDLNFLQTVANSLWLAISRKRNLEQLELERQELRQLADSLPMMIGIVRPDEAHAFANRAYEELGVTPSEVIGESVRDMLGSEPYGIASPHIRKALAGDSQQYELPVEINGSQRVKLVSYTPRLDKEGQPDGFYSTALDITERKREEERTKVISAELDHRVKNILATILSIARATSRGASSVADYADHFEDRLLALSRAHGHLAASEWGGLSLSTLIDEELDPYANPARTQIAYSGPPVRLSLDAAQPMALVLHELTTNAVKHGALSTPDGELRVSWAIDHTQPQKLKLTWDESGLNIEEPRHSGFGMSIIGHIIERQLDATSRLEFRQTGILYVLDLPATSFQT